MAGAPKGNQNARGSLSTRKLADREKAARLRADRLLNMATPYAVRTLIKIMRAPDSTNLDRSHAAVAILDRKIPRMTQAELALKAAPRVMLEVPGLNSRWPAALTEAVDDDNPAEAPNGNGHAH